jgi:hypothetical protein
MGLDVFLVRDAQNYISFDDPIMQKENGFPFDRYGIPIHEERNDQLFQVARRGAEQYEEATGNRPDLETLRKIVQQSTGYDPSAEQAIKLFQDLYGKEGVQE